jgi:hypothetical protein
MKLREQSSTSDRKIIMPNNDLVGVKKSEKKIRRKRRSKITKAYGLETFSLTFQNEKEN